MAGTKYHSLKTLPEYFREVASGKKTFEIRVNDRGFRVGDHLVLKEWIPADWLEMAPPGYTGHEITREISYLFEGGKYGLEAGWCVLGLKEPAQQYRKPVYNGSFLQWLSADTIKNQERFTLVALYDIFLKQIAAGEIP